MWCSIRRRGSAWAVVALIGRAAWAAAGADEPLLLAVNINGVDRGEVVSARRLSDGGLAVAAQDLQNWRLKPPAGGVLRINGHAWVRLADLEGVAWHIDMESQTIMLQAPGASFAGTALAYGETDGVQLTPSAAGGFFNYDLYHQRDGGRDGGGGLFELGAFNTHGSGTATAVWRDTGMLRRWARLDTTWTMDLPQHMQSLRFGDAIGRAGAWGRAVRFGGLQWGTNFATQPGFIAFPLPTLRGEAALPSTLDVYLDNTRLLQSEVPAGPFDVTNVPVVTGQGQLRLVVRDLLGRQQVITQPYYTSPQLLRPGLHDFSVEAGAVREDYGVASGRYGRFMAVATDRLGIDAGFTRELRAEFLGDQQTLGAGGVWLLPGRGAPAGTLSASAAASHGRDGGGRLLALGLDRQARDLGVGLRTQYASRDFVQIGQLPGFTPRRTLTASLGLPLGGNALGVSYVRQSTWQGNEHRLLSASYSLRLGAALQLGLYALRDYGGASDTSVGVIVTVAMDARTSLNAEVARQGRQDRKMVQLQRNLPAGNGFGYRLLAGDHRHYLAGGALQTDRASFTLEAASFAGQAGYRAGVSGGVAVAGGGVFPSRRIEESFAVVKVGDYAGVRIYRDNQEVARTDANGLALVTRLRAYQDNPVSIEQADLPLDAEVDTLRLKLAPALKSGVVVAFPVRRSRGAAFRLVDDAGVALPPGAVVRIEGDAREFPVGFDGRVFVTGLGKNSRLSAQWQGRRCTVAPPAVDGTEPLPDLGTLTCKGSS